MSEYVPRDHFDCTPQQYHAGLDKLWRALGVTGVQDEDVFTLVEKEIGRLREAYELLRMATFGAHSAHFDRTGGSGSGCPECLRMRKIRAEADSFCKRTTGKAE